MKKVTILAGLSLLAAIQVQANELVLFDAAEQCQVRQTTQGERFVPPCTLPQQGLTLGQGEDIPAELNTLLSQESLHYMFTCETLRPFSLEYQIHHQGQLVQTGQLTPANNTETRVLTLPPLTGDSQLTISDITGASGFQAIKPGCVLRAEYGGLPESRSLSLLQRILVVKAQTAKKLMKMDPATYQQQLDDEFERLKTITGFVVLTQDPGMGQSLFELINLVNKHRLVCMQGRCASEAEKEFTDLYQQHKNSLIQIRHYLQQQVDRLAEQKDKRGSEYRHLLIYLNIELYSL